MAERPNRRPLQANTKAPVAQRGKAKQKRTDLRLVGLGLVLTRDGGIPLLSHAYAGNRPDVTQFTTVIDKLTADYQALDDHAQACAGHGRGGTETDVTVVFDAGQNSVDNFAHLATTKLGYVGSVPPSDQPDLLALPASGRTPVDPERFAGLTAVETRREIYGAARRVVLTHSPSTPNRPAASTRPWPRPAHDSRRWQPPWPAEPRPGGSRDHQHLRGHLAQTRPRLGTDRPHPGPASADLEAPQV